MTVNRSFKEAPLKQGNDEKIPYELITTPWGSNPTSTVCRVMVRGGETDSNLLDGNTSVAGDVITTGLVQNLQDNTNYRIEIQFNIGTTVFEAYGEIQVD